MIEVFKTNVISQLHASILVNRIQEKFSHYSANFDLVDCDKILRIKCNRGGVQPSAVIGLLKDLGFHAEVLPDDQEPLLSDIFNFQRLTSE
jgi:hypothetical protein